MWRDCLGPINDVDQNCGQAVGLHREKGGQSHWKPCIWTALLLGSIITVIIFRRQEKAGGCGFGLVFALADWVSAGPGRLSEFREAGWKAGGRKDVLPVLLGAGLHEAAHGFPKARGWVPVPVLRPFAAGVWGGRARLPRVDNDLFISSGKSTERNQTGCAWKGLLAHRSKTGHRWSWRGMKQLNLCL